MSDRQITGSGLTGGFAFFLVQLLASYAVVWWNLNQSIVLGGITDYVLIGELAAFLGFLAVVVLGLSGDRLILKILPMIGLWVLVGGLLFVLNLITLRLFEAELVLVSVTSIVIGVAHWLTA